MLETRNSAPNVFNQHDRTHQDWLLQELGPRRLDGFESRDYLLHFFELQDLADLLHGQPSSSLGSVMAGYCRRRAELAPQEFIRALVEAKARRGIDFGAAELNVRLRGAA